jgi:hypothetical protein
MKWIITFVFLFVVLFDSSAQSLRLKRKYCKEYQGEMPKYSALIGQEIVEISPSKIELNLHKDSLYLTIGRSYYNGNYSVEKSLNPDEIILVMERKNSEIEERFILNLPNKTIVRKGIFPQPDTPLIRVKKSSKRDPH